jgi:hypothetical protein
MITRNLRTTFTAFTFLGAAFVTFSPRAPFVAAGAPALADGDCRAHCAERFADCDKHAGPREEHDRCGKERAECEKSCDDHR